MAVRQYVGARYVPKFYKNSQNPLRSDWEGNKAYEALTIVQYNNSSYTSKIPVPAGIGNPADNPTYWVNTGDYNAQVEQYRQEVATAVETVQQVQEQANDTQSNLTILQNNYNNKTKGFTTPEIFGAKADGVTDDTTAVQNCVNYCNENHCTMYGSGGTYLISANIESNDELEINMMNSTIKSLNSSSLKINGKQRYEKHNYIQNIRFDNVNLITDTYGYVYQNLSFYNVNGTAIHVLNGVENRYQFIYMRGNGTKTVGIQIDALDNEFSDMILVDIYTCFIAYGLERISNIHAWILTPELYTGSSIFKTSATSNFYLFNIYCDTYDNYILSNEETTENRFSSTYVQVYTNTSVSGTANTFTLINGGSGIASFTSCYLVLPNDFTKNITNNKYLEYWYDCTKNNGIILNNNRNFTLTSTYQIAFDESVITQFGANVAMCIQARNISAGDLQIATDSGYWLKLYTNDIYFQCVYTNVNNIYKPLGYITVRKHSNGFIASIPQEIVTAHPEGIAIYLNYNCPILSI